jgi:hypothetical protein
MTNLILMVAIFTATLTGSSFAQTTANTQTVNILPTYFKLKDALISGDAKLVASSAAGFNEVLLQSDSKIIEDADLKNLIQSSNLIKNSKDIDSQRTNFANLSKTIISLARKSKISSAPIYVQYCPMKKSSWLSNEKTIKNPYYGTSMLTCGTVTSML